MEPNEDEIAAAAAAGRLLRHSRRRVAAAAAKMPPSYVGAHARKQLTSALSYNKLLCLRRSEREATAAHLDGQTRRQCDNQVHIEHQAEQPANRLDAQPILADRLGRQNGDSQNGQDDESAQSRNYFQRQRHARANSKSAINQRIYTNDTANVAATRNTSDPWRSQTIFGAPLAPHQVAEGENVIPQQQQPSSSRRRRRQLFLSAKRRAPKGSRARCQTLIASSAAATLLLAMLTLLGACHAYQLTNNLIANNLPPKFVQMPAAAAASSSSSSSSTNSGATSGGANSEIVVRVKEGPQSIGKLIYSLKAEDPDDDALTFGVLGSMASELLRIENTPGNQANVYLRKELDRETTESHQVVITLTDGKLGKGNWVEDVNDNYPVFAPHRTAISIREDARAPLIIETLEASDADEGRFGQVIYKLDELSPTLGGGGGGNENGQTPTTTNQQQASIASMFAIETIDGRGVITLIGQLDYEQRPLYQLRVLAIDRAVEHERLSTSTSILISVEDCEDQPPMFTFAPAITRIPEDLAVGSPILRLAAIDGDRGVNNPIKYSIVSVNNQESGFERNLFSIGSDSGQISVAHELDREQTLDFGSLSKSSTSSTGGGSSSSSSQSSSSQPGAYVLEVRASEVSADLEESGAQSAQSVTTELTVILTDVNDETPHFNRDYFLGELLENSPGESLISFVPQAGELSSAEASPKVFDRDQGTNGTFTLHLEGEHGHLFDIWPSEATNEASLMVKVSSAALQQEAAAAANSKYFDFERTKELRVTLVAREKFSPPASSMKLQQQRRFSSAQLVIQLRDSNDNYPQFDSELYRVEIPENAQRGMHICVVRALDSDSGLLGSAGVRYTEIRGERANKFKLDPQTGIITLRTNEHGFDRETIAQHHLIVEARDNNGQGNRNTTQLLIVLTDVNDQKPKFLLDTYEAFIYENELDFQSPLQVQALDGDAPNSPNSRIAYSIINGDPQSNFTIDPQTGRIKVRTSLVMPPPPTSVIKPTHLNGANQHSPSSDLASINMPSESDIVIASELSQSGPAQVTASPVQQVTGLDFERIAQKRDDTRQFNLTIRASDFGSPEPLTDTTQVLILVYDKNDHAPIFTRPVYSKSLREDAPPGSAVLQVQALDGDHSPSNSKITYRISSGASDKFVVDADTGLVSVANGANLDVDRAVTSATSGNVNQQQVRRQTNYLLNILASDGSFGPHQKSASTLVNITIIDVNNKAPEFVSLGASQVGRSADLLTSGKQLNSMNQQQQHFQSSTVFVNEDAPYGLIVTRVFAIDLDSSAELRYSINYARSEARNEEMALVEPSLYRDVFTIEPIDGTIKVSKQLDRELCDQVKLRVQVEDLAAQTADQQSYTYLTIRIADINDNRPTFRRPIYKAVVNENSISGTSVIALAADDRDLNKTLRYSLEASAPEIARLIRINPRTGEVTVNDKIDRELFPMINVTIKAEDFGLPHSLTGTCQLIVTVRDENDNNPIFMNATHLKPSRGLASPPAISDEGGDQAQPRNHNMAPTSYRHRSLGPPSNINDQPQPPSPAAESTSESLEAAGNVNLPHLRSPLDEQGRELTLLAPGATAWVPEDAPPGHQVAYVRAEDADVGNNGRVTYLLDATSNSGGKFRIDRDSGILSVAQPLDRETQQHFALIIEACDNYDLGYATGESRRAFTQVNIKLSDINDEAPLVTTNLQGSSNNQLPSLSLGSNNHHQLLLNGYPTYEEAMQSPGPFDMPLAECLFINEFQPANEPILTITALDLDDPNTPNGQVDLAIINNLPQNDLFSLIAFNSEGSSASPSSTTTPSPSDDLIPVSTSTTAATSTHSTELTNGDGDPLSGFGDLSMAASLQQTSNARVRVPPAPVKQRNKRSHLNEEEPRSLEPGNFYAPISMASSQAQQRARATATTTNKPANGFQRRVTNLPTATTSANGQKLIPGEQQMHLVASQSLKEKVGNYSLLVRATDRGQPALTSVKLINVCVLDVNNHAPIFTKPPLNHTIRIMENATIGSYVTQVEATDLDHGLNGELQYALKPTNIQNSNNDWQAFKIDRLSGVISTTKLFNRQLKKYYTLRVQAQDFGRPTSLTSDIDINIMIVNSGKYQPEFEQQNQALQLTENSPPGREWFTLLQTTNLDDDPALIHVNNLAGTTTSTSTSISDNNSTRRGPASQQSNGSSGNWLSSPCYYIVDGDDQEQVFHLDRYTHRLANQRELDRERKANYTLIIQASNNCNQPPPSNRIASIRSSLQTVAPGDELTTTPATVAAAEDLRRSKRSASSSSSSLLSPMQVRSSKRIQSLTTSENDDEAVDLTTTAKLDSAQLLPLDQVAGQMALSSQPNIDWDTLIAGDKSLLKVSIKIRDLNDNAPKFTQRVYTGGITTEADFGTTFMIVQAIDLDAEANGQVTYSIVRPIKRNLSLSGQSTSAPPATTSHQKTTVMTGNRLKRTATSQQSNFPIPATTTTTTTTTSKPTHLQFPFNSNSVNEVYTNELASTHQGASGGGLIASDGNNNDLATSLLSESDELFVISAQTGEISLNFDPQKHMKGYFEFEIQAKDSDGLSDSAKVFIYLLRQDQRVKFVLRLTPLELRQKLNKFRSVMGNITGAIVNIDSYKYHENHDGTVDKKKTSLYLHFVNQEDNTIIEVDKVLTLIDNNIEYLDELYKEFHVLSSEAAHLPLSSGALVDPIDQVRTGLMGISSFLALILILVIALCLNQRTRYERQLKAATVSAFGSSPLHLDPDFHSQTNLPNTNLHSQDPNPIWINGHYGAAAAASDEHARNNINSSNDPTDWLGGSEGGNGHTSPSSQQQFRHHQHHNLMSNTNAKNASKRPQKQGLGTKTTIVTAQQHKQQQPQMNGAKLYHSASSGVGMALDDDDGELDCLSSCEGDRSSDLNSLSGGANSVGQLHYNVTTATATPRDSLNSSHGQVSSSSGSNSASTTNERQALCTSGSGKQIARSNQQQSPINVSNNSKHQTKAKLGSRQNESQIAASGLANSTFGAFKEVTIYTEGQRQQQQSFNHLVVGQHQQQHQQQQQLNSNKGRQTTNANQQQQPPPSNHVNKLASQFSASKLQKQSIYVVGQHSAKQAASQITASNQDNGQKARIVVHTNGSDVNQGIIKTAAPTGPAGKQLQNNLDAKFVPANHDMSSQQQQTVANFETSLSKLSILNLETTEL